MKQIITYLLLLFVSINHLFAQQIDKSQYVIFPYSDSDQFISRKFPSYCIKSTLNESEIVEIDSLLEACLKEYNGKQVAEYNAIHQEHPETKLEWFIINDLKNYKFQIIVAKTPQGYKTIWINCFCAKNGDEWVKNNWQKHVIHVDDGGKCFFNLMIDLTRKFYYDFSVNDNG